MLTPAQALRDCDITAWDRHLLQLLDYVSAICFVVFLFKSSWSRMCGIHHARYSNALLLWYCEGLRSDRQSYTGVHCWESLDGHSQ